MKKYLSLFVVLAFMFSFNVSSVRAEEAVNEVEANSYKQKQEELQKEFDLKREVFKKEFEASREEAKSKMEALRESLKTEKDALKLKAKEARIVGRENALERFDAAVLRMNTLKDRVSEQIVKLEARGIDTKIAKEHIGIAETKLNEAKAKIIEATTLLGTSITELTAENKTTLKTLAQKTQTLLQETRSHLNNAIKALKEAIKIKKTAGVEKSSSAE